MPDTPFPVLPIAQPARPVTPPNVWLCAEPHEYSPEFSAGFSAGLSVAPLWARRIVAALSEPRERVIIRALRGYPGLPADAAALLSAAAAGGRRPVALLPTPHLAARTRTWLRPPAPGTPVPNRQALGAAATHRAPALDSVAIGEHPTGNPTHVATEHYVAGGTRAATHPRSAATGRCLATRLTATTGPATATSPAAATDPSTVTSTSAVTGVGAATGTSERHCRPLAVAGVGVGRRRAGVEHGPAAAVIVLAGPVGAHARPARRAMPSARVLGQWARALHPGGVIGVLAPPPTGRHRRGGGWRHGPVPGLAEAGLVWSDRIVLIHAGTQPPGEFQPSWSTQLPFAPVHTYLDLFEPHTDPPEPDSPAGADGSPGVGR